MSEETQAKAPAASDAASTPQAPSERGPGSGSGSGHGPSSGPRGAGRPGGGPGGRGKFFRRKKVCKFCTEKIDAIPYRDVKLLRAVCGRARQDCAAAADRCLHHAPAPSDPRHQAGPEHRAAAVCHQALNRRLPATSGERCSCRSGFVSGGFQSGRDSSRAESWRKMRWGFGPGRKRAALF